MNCSMVRAFPCIWNGRLPTDTVREMTGCDGHPSAEAQREMAEDLKSFFCVNAGMESV